MLIQYYHYIIKGTVEGKVYDELSEFSDFRTLAQVMLGDYVAESGIFGVEDSIKFRMVEKAESVQCLISVAKR